MKRRIVKRYDKVNDKWTVDYFKIYESSVTCIRFESQLFCRNNRPCFRKNKNVIYLGIDFIRTISHFLDNV